LQNAKLLEELHLSVGVGRSLVGLHDILSPSARTLKFLGLKVFLYDNGLHLAGICEELKAMAGDNMLEVLSFEVHVGHSRWHLLVETVDSIGLTIQSVEKVLLKHGWSALRQVSFKLLMPDGESRHERLQSLPDKYLSHLSKLESVAFNYSVSDNLASVDWYRQYLSFKFDKNLNIYFVIFYSTIIFSPAIL
jgi:hypothetical protein